MDVNLCDVCQVEPSIGTACSTLGAFSLSYCLNCQIMTAEPYGFLASTVDMLGGVEAVADWVHELTTVIDGTYFTFDAVFP
jgi:hypothetical protein